MRTYTISTFYKSKMLRDTPKDFESSVQGQYIDLLMGLFMRKFMKIYSPEPLTPADEAKLEKYFYRILEAKNASAKTEEEKAEKESRK